MNFLLMNKPLLQETTSHKGIAAWCRRLGVLGILFFFIKGLIWILLFIILPYLGFSD